MNNVNVEKALELIRPIFEEAQAYIDTMKVGDKTPAVKLAEEIAKRHGQTGPQLYPTLKVFFDNHDELEVRRGAYGGLFKVESKAAALAKAQAEAAAIHLEVAVAEIKENMGQ